MIRRILKKEEIEKLANTSGINTGDEVFEFADLASLPVTGTLGIIYIALDTNLLYRWNGSHYVLLGDGTTTTTKRSGGMYIVNSAETEPNNSNTPLKVNVGATAEFGNNFGFTTSSNQRVTLNAGEPNGLEYHAIVSFTAYSDGNRTCNFYIAKNGVIDTTTQITAELQNNEDKALSSSIQWKGTLNENDYLELWVENTENDDELEISKMNFVVKEV